jgi:carbon starvation protein
MPAIFVAAVVAVIFLLGYRYYGKYLAERVYVLDDRRLTPAHTMMDGVDFVPTNKHVLFGHHFTSVAGAAPIVGPAVGVFWGWGPALAWVVLGTVFAAGVHDFGAIVVSMRNRAQNIGTLTRTVINERSRVLFLAIIFFLLTLVNAVFAVVIGNLFVANPGAVIPIFVEIPVAIFIGQYIYKKKTSALGPSLIGVGILYILIAVGQRYPITAVADLSVSLGLQPRTLWVVIMFVYAFIASRIPVWVLLQPRDYINSHQLFIALGVIFLGVLVGFDRIVAPVVNTNLPEGSPNFFPFLFVTIACGAISGFHSLVSSGTTSKQIDKESDAKYVGYAGSIGEGSLAVGSILAATAGIAIVGLDWNERYADFGTASGGAVGNFVNGVAGFASNLGVPVDLGRVFAAVVVISFAATTMDTGVRLQRYIIAELGSLIPAKAGPVGGVVRKVGSNVTAATAAAVVIPFALAVAPARGTSTAGFAFGDLWRIFGTTNQLTAGLALAVIATYVARQGRNPVAQLVPLAFLLVMTTWALVLQVTGLFQAGDWLLGPLSSVILVLALWLIYEAVTSIRAALAASRAGTPMGGGEGGASVGSGPASGSSAPSSEMPGSGMPEWGGGTN